MLEKAKVNKWPNSPKKQSKLLDGFTCQVCGDNKDSKGVLITAHHIEHTYYGGENSLKNLITLCLLCHAFTHKIVPSGVDPTIYTQEILYEEGLLDEIQGAEED